MANAPNGGSQIAAVAPLQSTKGLPDGNLSEQVINIVIGAFDLSKITVLLADELALSKPSICLPRVGAAEARDKNPLVRTRSPGPYGKQIDGGLGNASSSTTAKP